MGWLKRLLGREKKIPGNPWYEFYGGDNTIHSSGHLDVETFRGEVVAVWYRYRLLKFRQCPVDPSRARDMQEDYRNYRCPNILGVYFEGEGSE